MAEVVADFDVIPRREKYDPAWCDGRTWKLTKGVDFFADVTKFRGWLSSRANGEGLSVRSKIDGDTVYFQATKKTGESK